MASVNWEKCKDRTTAKAILKHNAKDTRLKNNHSNKDIDKALTNRNLELVGGRNYAECCAVYEQRIAALDSAAAAKGAKKPRKDRVELLFLDIPAPENMAESDCKAFFTDVTEVLQQRFGAENVVSAAVHFDEVHDYTDAATGKARRSRPHIHVALIPETGGRLCAKEVCSKGNMIWLNNNIDKLSREKYKLRFMDGSKKKSLDTVEALKNRSLKAENKQLQQQKDEMNDEIKLQHRILDKRKERLDNREKEVEQRELNVHQQEQQLLQQQAKTAELQLQLQEHIDELKAAAALCKDETKKKAQALAKRSAALAQSSSSHSVNAARSTDFGKV